MFQVSLFHFLWSHLKNHFKWKLFMLLLWRFPFIYPIQLPIFNCNLLYFINHPNWERFSISSLSIHLETYSIYLPLPLVKCIDYLVWMVISKWYPDCLVLVMRCRELGLSLIHAQGHCWKWCGHLHRWAAVGSQVCVCMLAPFARDSLPQVTL